MAVTALVAVVVVVIVLLAVGGRSKAPRPTPTDPLATALDRAVAASILTREQASAVLAAERARVPQPAEVSAARPARVPPVAEALGYLGAVLAGVGVAVLIGQYWEDLATWSRLAIVGGVGLVLLVIGAMLDERADVVLWRLRAFLWLLSTAAMTGVAALVAVDVLEWEGEPVTIAVGVATAAYAAILWGYRDRPGQQVATLVGLAVALGGLMALVDDAAAIGLATVGLGAAWLVLGWHRLLPPRLAALPLGALTVLVGPAIVNASWPEAGPLIGLAVAVALVVAGTRLDEFALTAAGAVGAFIYLPWSLGAVFGEQFGAPFVFLVSGLALLAVMVVILRRRGTGLGGHGLAPPPALH